MEDNFHPSIDHLFTAHDLGLDKPMDQFQQSPDTQSPHGSAYEEIPSLLHIMMAKEKIHLQIRKFSVLNLASKIVPIILESEPQKSDSQMSESQMSKSQKSKYKISEPQRFTWKVLIIVAPRRG